MQKIDNDILKQAILEYRTAGKKLMMDLGKKFGLDITQKEDFEKLISRSNKTISRKGELSQRWNYAFHGGECLFYNKKHQQTVQVVLSNPPEFGHLDAWFLMEFMESTKPYKDVVSNFRWFDLKPAIQELYRIGEIENI